MMESGFKGSLNSHQSRRSYSYAAANSTKSPSNSGATVTQLPESVVTSPHGQLPSVAAVNLATAELQLHHC